MKYIVLLCDGLADRPVKELDNKTRLQLQKEYLLKEVLQHHITCGLCKEDADKIEHQAHYVEFSTELGLN